MAVREIYKDHDERVERLYALKDRLVQGLSSLEGVTVHGRTGRDSAPQIVSAGFEGVRAEVLYMPWRTGGSTFPPALPAPPIIRGSPEP